MKFLYAGTLKKDSFYLKEKIKILNIVLLFSIFYFCSRAIIEYVFNHPFFLINVFPFFYYLLIAVFLFVVLWTRIKLNVIFTSSIIFVNIIIIYFQISYHPLLNFFSYYILSILIIVFFFDFKKEKKLLIFLICFTTIVYIISFFNADFDHLQVNFGYFISSFSVSFVYISGILYGIYQKIKLKQLMLLKQNDTKVHLSEVLALAKTDDPGFLSLFGELHPQFIENLNDKHQNLSLNEQKFCAMLYLKFTTKEIANFTNISIRSVQTKKYNLRKKLSLKDADLYTFLSELG